MANTASTPPECVACDRKFSREEDSYTYGTLKFCFECLKRRMDMLITSSDGYPCIVEGTTSTLHPSTFSPTLFGGPQKHDMYMGLFDMKKREWETPVPLRLYCTSCPTAMFIGSLSVDITNHTHMFGNCGSCFSDWCMKCGTQFVYNDQNVRYHVKGCTVAEAAKRVAASEAAMVGLTRGVDWQICPGCKGRVQHAGGCNHMTCETCRVHFCYVCGCRAAEGSGHWKGASQVGDKCIFVGVDEARAAKGHEKRAAAETK
jgi:hypothetical protein